MSQKQFLTAAMGGLKTYKSAAGSLVDSNLLSVLGLTAFPADFYGSFDIKIFTGGPVYITINGDAADANAMPFETGEKWEVRNCNELAKAMRFFAAAAYDMRIALYRGGLP